ncbi:hypothetical protein HPB47_019625, partial [Ixodes persulcatus]
MLLFYHLESQWDDGTSPEPAAGGREEAHPALPSTFVGRQDTRSPGPRPEYPSYPHNEGDSPHPLDADITEQE